MMSKEKKSFNQFQIWVSAARPKTLTASLAPVLFGISFAAKKGVFLPIYAILTLGAALAIQIATNFINDYFDFKKGADRSDRKGPLRVMQAGLVDRRTMKIAIAVALIIAVYLSLFLIYRGGAIILIIGIISIICAFLYTAGPMPLAYLGLGDLFVLIFFGPIAVCGTYYLQTLAWSYEVCFAGLAPGLLSLAILTVNNLRDVKEDRISNKQTLAVRFGTNFTQTEYVGAVILSIIIFIILGFRGFMPLWYTLTASVIFLYLSFESIFTVVFNAQHDELNRTLERTGKLLFIFSIFFLIGCLL